jgi:hypothetical protein
MVGVAQLVRASVCGTECRGFEPRHSPHFAALRNEGFFIGFKGLTAISGQRRTIHL